MRISSKRSHMYTLICSPSRANLIDRLKAMYECQEDENVTVQNKPNVAFKHILAKANLGVQQIWLRMSVSFHLISELNDMHLLRDLHEEQR